MRKFPVGRGVHRAADIGSDGVLPDAWSVGAVDMVDYVISELGPAHMALWSWAVALRTFGHGMFACNGVTFCTGRLVIDQSADKRNPEFIEAWRQRFGESQVRITRTIASSTGSGTTNTWCLGHGSFNLNYSVRCENCCVEVDSPAFDLVASIEDELPVLPRNYSSAEVMAAGKLDRAFPPEVLSISSIRVPGRRFNDLKTWEA